MQRDNSDFKTLETIGILSLACLVFGLLLKLQVLFYVALGLLFIGLFVKSLSAKIAQGWLKFAVALGTINTKIILTLVFYLFLLPLAFLYRIFHGDFMNLKDKKMSLETYWNRRDHKYKPEDLKNVW